MTAGQRLDGPTEPHDDSCRDVLDWTLDQIALAIDQTDRVRAPLATALVFGQAWMERTRRDDTEPPTD
jgi:hypothetical protein